MNDRDDQSIDNELSGLAMAATHEHERTVSANETEAALTAVRSRIAGGDLGGVPPSIDLVRERSRRSPLILLGAAAAVIGMIALGLVAVVGGNRTNDVITPATAPVAEPTPITGPLTTEPQPEPSTTAADTVAPDPSSPEATSFVEQTISVDAANPPTSIEPTVWRSVPIDPANGEGTAWIAIGDDSVLVKQKGVQSITVLDRVGDGRRDVALDEDLGTITAGPFGTVYGFGGPVFAADNQVVPRGFRFVGISLTDDGPASAGTVFDAAEIDANRFLELPPYPFGTGDTGVIDRTRNIGDTIIEFSAGRGTEVGSRGVPVPRFADNDGGFSDVATGRVEIPERGWAWNLDIRRDPNNNTGFAGPSAPAPTTGNRVVYFERIGAADSAADFARSAMPVVAMLNPDGSGRWVRLPDEWDVVASDVWGTVLMRTTTTDFEFALLDDVLPPEDDTPAATVPARSDPNAEVLAIPRTCVAESECTQLASTENGRLVAFDPADETLRVYDATGNSLQTEVPVVGAGPLDFTWLVSVGPDDVAYLGTITPQSTDSQGDLIAIPLVGTNAGRSVMRWANGLDFTGDSGLMPRRAGLTVVWCCGDRSPRPALDAPIFRWVDRNGQVIESTAPSFDLTLGDAGSSLTRIDGEATFTRFTLPTVFQYPRDFPTTIATDDGGALSLDYLQPSGPLVIVDFNTDWPEFGIDNGDVYYLDETPDFGSILLEPAGTVVIADGDVFVRRSLDEIATRGWPGQIVIQQTLEVWAVDAPGLNEYIDEQQPVWAADPTLLAYQIVPKVDANEQVSVEYDEASGGLLITTSGFLDDSVFATRIALPIELGADGLFRISGTGSQSQQCQPGRGHQDFSVELCI